ncbi:MAG: hypothetical protein H6737_02525 [Alphaproteobacteria bacterium]|nr:hypothetical protein [Alphaproteobacteria bacterium]
MILAALAVAHAGVVVSAAGLYDTPSEQSLVGVQAHLTCEAQKGFCWTGRLAAGFDVRGNGFGAITEIGGLAVIPSVEVADIRFGVGLRGVHIQRDLPIVLQWETATKPLRWGMVPQVFLQGELAWTPEAPLVVGATVGASPWAGIDPTCQDEDDPQVCASWNTSFVASFWGRKTLKNGLTFQAGFGTLIEGSVGYRF